MIEMINGSILQVVGSDNIDALMSTNPIGCVFAEYALQHPRAWEYIRPILKENGGWAIFDFTPRGKNHGYELYNLAKSLMESGDPNWFCQKLTVDDTGVLTQADIDAERREGMSDDMVQQEYFCSFEGVQQGSIFGRQMNEAEHSGRICAVPHQPEFPVDTWWDIGMDDPMAIWFTQTVGREIHLIDYYENNGLGMQHYAQVLQSKGYTYGTHNAPHDIEVREIGSGKSRRETALNFGIRFAVVPNIALADGIDAARNFLARCWFDREKCKIGLAALTSYHHLWNEDRKQYSSEPYHDWSSNGADAFRYLAVGHKVTVKKREAVVVQTVRYENEDSVAWMGT